MLIVHDFACLLFGVDFNAVPPLDEEAFATIHHWRFEFRGSVEKRFARKSRIQSVRQSHQLSERYSHIAAEKKQSILDMCSQVHKNLLPACVRLAFVGLGLFIEKAEPTFRYS